MTSHNVCDQTYAVSIHHTRLDRENLFITSFAAELLNPPVDLPDDWRADRAIIQVSSEIDGYEHIEKGREVEVDVRPRLSSHDFKVFLHALRVRPVDGIE